MLGQRKGITLNSRGDHRSLGWVTIYSFEGGKINLKRNRFACAAILTVLKFPVKAVDVAGMEVWRKRRQGYGKSSAVQKEMKKTWQFLLARSGFGDFIFSSSPPPPFFLPGTVALFCSHVPSIPGYPCIAFLFSFLSFWACLIQMFFLVHIHMNACA